VLDAMILFAQQKGAKGEAEATAALIVGSTVCCSIVLSIFTTGLLIYYLVVAYKALNAVSPENRDMEPGMVFLYFIPLFGPLVWNFFIVFRIASSLQKEFDERGIRSDGGDFGQTLGLWTVILTLISCFPVNVVLAFMWLGKIRGYTAQLTRRRSRSDDDD